MKNRTLKASLIVLLLAMITLAIISGTLAKYVETVSGTDSARVAKFEYSATAGGVELTKNTAASINLFNTVNDTEVYGASQNTNTQKLVAPGTCGTFDIVASNTSEVKVAVTYSMTETNSNNIPIVYCIKNGGTTKYYSSVETGTITIGNDVKTALSIPTNTITINGDLTDMLADASAELAATDGTTATTATTTVSWFWAFGDGTNDTRDTGLGTTGTATVSVLVNATFTQVD